MSMTMRTILTSAIIVASPLRERRRLESIATTCRYAIVEQKELVTIAKARSRQPSWFPSLDARVVNRRKDKGPGDLLRNTRATIFSPAFAHMRGRRRGWSRTHAHISCIWPSPQTAGVRTLPRALMKRLTEDLERRHRLSRLLLQRRILFHRGQSRLCPSHRHERSRTIWSRDTMRKRTG